MNQRPARLLALGLSAALACAGYGGWVLVSRQHRLQDLRETAAKVERDAALARWERDRAVHALTEAQAALRETPEPHPTAQLLSGIVMSLRDRFVTNPAAAIPELELLEDRDWYQQAVDPASMAGRLDQGRNLQVALSNLREKAKLKLQRTMKLALLAYAENNGGLLPSNTRQLTPHFDPPINPSILDRYQILRTGRLVDVPQDRLVMGEVAPVDPEMGYLLGWRGPTVNFGGMPNDEIKRTLADAKKKFEIDHPNAQVADPGQLLPYFTRPADSDIPDRTLRNWPFDPDELRRNWHLFGFGSP